MKQVKTYVPMNIMITPELRERLDLMAKVTKQSKRAIVIQAISAELDCFEVQLEHGEVMGSGL